MKMGISNNERYAVKQVETHKKTVEDKGYDYIYTYERKDKLKDSGKILGVDTDVKNKRTFVRVKCPYCKYSYDIRWDSFKQRGNKCTNCCHNYKNSLAYYIEVELGLNINDVWDFELNNKMNINPYYITKGTHTKAYFKCLNNIHESELKTVNSFVNGNRCNECRKENVGDNTRLPYEYVKSEIEKEGFELLSKEYKNSSSELIIKCPKGHEYKTSWICFKSGRRCNICNTSRGEQKILKVLDNHNIKYEVQYKFKDCKFKKPLPFDFYLIDYNVLIEYDGVQHYEIINHFGGLDEFINTKIRDTVKNEYCKKNNIKLIRIPYWDFDRIEDIIVNELMISK